MSGESFSDCSPVFVVGSDRSGTTLLQLMLNAHPNVAVAGELHFFDQILELKKRIPDLDGATSIDELFRLLPRVAGLQYLTDFEPVLAAARDRLLAAERPTYELLYRYLLEGFARQQSARRFGEKTTANLRYLETLVRLFPACRIIHIVRDPRAAVASRLQVPWASDDVVTNAVKWKLEVSCGRSFARHDLARGRFLEVHYEEIVTDPTHTLQRVCDFIGEPYNPRMLEYHRAASAYVEKEPWKHGTTKPIYKSSLDSWRQRLSEPQILLIELITRAEMAHYGYQRSALSRGAAWRTPWNLAREIARWFEYKRVERRQRRDEPILVYGDQRRLLQILWRNLGR